jgi:hypothetical protein
MSKRNYEQGGRVKISGKWWDVVEVEAGEINLNDKGWLASEWANDFCEAYEPPKPKTDSKTFNWAEKIKLPSHFIPNEEVNKRLTETFGDPTERVYKGKPASEFGLKPNTHILWWRMADKKWAGITFDALPEGAIWRKQPPLLTTNKGI